MATATNGNGNGAPGPSKVRLSLDLDIKTLAHIAQVLAVIGGLIWAFIDLRVSDARRAQQAALDQQATTNKLDDMEETFKSAAKDMRGQLSTLPAQSARLDQIERRQSAADTQRDKFADRLDAIQQQLSSLRSDLGHASNGGGR